MSAGRVPRHVASPNQHILTAEDVVSCCLDLSVPSISFRINGHPVQGMFENFNLDGLFFPVVSFSAGVTWEILSPWYFFIHIFCCVILTQKIFLSFLLISQGFGFYWEAVMGILSFFHHPAMLRAMKQCCRGTGCGLSPSRSTNMILMACAICWVQLSLFHTQPSLLALWTQYK